MIDLVSLRQAWPPVGESARTFALTAVASLPAPAAPPVCLRFGRFELQAQQCQLLRDGQPVPLGARALDLLVVLANRAGQLVSRGELLALVWPGLVVEENNLSVQINTLRRVLGGEVVATIPGRGYRFIAAVEGAAPAAGRSVSPTVSPTALPTAVPTAETAKLKTNLPTGLAPLLGRDAELRTLGDLVDRHRLVTLVGAGGMGKSRLAQALLQARRGHYPHGVCWVELGPLSAAETVPAAHSAAVAGAIAAALGLEHRPDDLLAGLVRAAASLQMLVALDNAEHLLDGVARVAESLHAAAPGLRLLVTSQAPLRLAAEQVMRLGALAVPPGPLPAEQARAYGAVALFAERAQAADGHFVLTDQNVAAVVTLCRRLDGLALAIELAAARAPTLGVHRVAALLDECLKLLTQSPNRAAPARQRSLRAALAWSHGFLDARAQAVFRRLAVVAGSASLGLIQKIAADFDDDLDEWAVLDALGVLVDRSLVAVLAPADGLPGIPPNSQPDTRAPRYRLLNSPRAFAQELLAASGELPGLRRRHALAVCDLLTAAEQAHWDGQVGEIDWHRGAEPDLDNGRDAFLWACHNGEPALALGLGAALLPLLRQAAQAETLAVCDACEALMGPQPTAPETCATAPPPAHCLPPALRIRALQAIVFRLQDRQPKRSQATAVQALALARGLAASPVQRWLLYVSLLAVGGHAARQGDTETGRRLLAQAQAAADPTWPPARLRGLPMIESAVATSLGDFARAQQCLRRHLVLALQAGRSGALTLMQLANCQAMAGDVAAAVATGTALVAQLQGSRDEDTLALCRLNLAAAHLAQNALPQARAQLLPAWPMALNFGMWWAVVHLALLAALEGRPRAALRLAACAERRCRAQAGVHEAREAAALGRARAVAGAALGGSAAELARLDAEGAALRDDELAALAFALTD